MDRVAGERDLACSPILSSYSPYTKEPQIWLFGSLSHVRFFPCIL